MILVMTTNAGAENISRRSIGFSMQDHSTDSIEAINRTFTPEFRNRLDAIIPFGPLGEDVILTVADKFLTELQSQLDERQVVIEVMRRRAGWLRRVMMRRWEHPQERVIQEHIKKPLADMVLFGSLVKVVLRW